MRIVFVFIELIQLDQQTYAVNSAMKINIETLTLLKQHINQCFQYYTFRCNLIKSVLLGVLGVKIKTDNVYEYHFKTFILCWFFIQRTLRFCFYVAVNSKQSVNLLDAYGKTNMIM